MLQGRISSKEISGLANNCNSQPQTSVKTPQIDKVSKQKLYFLQFSNQVAWEKQIKDFDIIELLGKYANFELLKYQDQSLLRDLENSQLEAKLIKVKSIEETKLDIEN